MRSRSHPGTGSLTDNEALRTAYEMGHFDIPRRAPWTPSPRTRHHRVLGLRATPAGADPAHRRDGRDDVAAASELTNRGTDRPTTTTGRGGCDER